MAERYDDVNTPVIAAIGLLGAILIFAIILLLVVVFYHADARERVEKHFGAPPAELSNLVADQQAELASYRWVDEKKGIVAIPINRAKELVLEEISKEPVPLRLFHCPRVRREPFPRANPLGKPDVPAALPESGVLPDPVDEKNEQPETKPAKPEEENDAS